MSLPPFISLPPPFISLPPSSPILRQNVAAGVMNGDQYALWFGDLNDLKILPDAGQDLYIRIPASELETKNGCKGKIRIAVWVTIGVLCGMLFVSCLIWNGRKKATLKGK
ncbi:hypothetical protein S245_004451 [Arachis hypogaea]